DAAAATTGVRIIRIDHAHDLRTRSGSAKRIIRQREEVSAVECLEHGEEIACARKCQFPVDARLNLLLPPQGTGVAAAVAGGTSSWSGVHEPAPGVDCGADLLPAQSIALLARTLLHRVHPGRLGPLDEQLIDQRELLRARGRARELLQHS